MSPSKECKAVLARFRAAHGDLVPTIQVLELDWPVAGEVSRRAAEFATDGLVYAYKDRNIPVVFRILEEALKAYDSHRGDEDVARFRRFAEAMINETARLLTGVTVVNGRGRWRPEDGHPLNEWWRHTCSEVAVRVEQGPAGRSAVEAAVKSYLLANVNLDALERHDG